MVKEIKVALLGSKKKDSLAQMLAHSFQNIGLDTKIFDSIISHDSGYHFKLARRFGRPVHGLLSFSEEIELFDIIVVTYRNLDFSRLNSLRKMERRPFLVHYNGDHIGTLDNQEIFYNTYDLYITKDERIYQVLQSIKRQVLLKDEATYSKLISQDEVTAGNGIVMTGNIYPYRLALLNQVKYPVQLYCSIAPGMSYNDINPIHQVKGGFVFGQNKLDIIKESSIVFNPYHYMDLGNLNQKFFEYGGMGKVQVVPFNSRLVEVVGKAIAGEIGFKNPSQINSIIERLLDSDTLRIELGEDIRDKVLRNHTYEHRVQEIIQFYENICNNT